MNYYRKIKLSFRGNTPMILDMDEALNDPYKKKKPNSDNTIELNTPGDQSASGYGTDYYSDRKPPVSSVKPEHSTRPKWSGDFDGQDPDKNDRKPEMMSGFGLYDPDSPLSIERMTADQINRHSRDNSTVGPFNQSNSSKTLDFFDIIKRRLN